MKKLLALCAMLSLFFIVPNTVRAETVLVSQGMFGEFYGDGGWSNMTAALDSATNNKVTVALNFEDLELMLCYDAIWLDQRWTSGSLTELEISNIRAYIETGRKVVMIGENWSNWSNWNSQILGIVGGTMPAWPNQADGYPTSILAHPLTVGASGGFPSLEMVWIKGAGIAVGGTALYSSNFATLWGANQNVLTILDVGVLSDAYWAANGNAAFATNVANWVADSGPATVTSYCIANKPVAQNTLTCVQAQQTIPQNSTITAVVPDSNVDFSYTGAIYYTALDGTDGVLDMGPLNVANYTPWPMFVMVDENLATFTGDIGVGARYKSNSETVFQGLEGKTVSELIATKLECHLTAGFFNGNQWHDDIWSTQWDVQAKLAEPNNAQAEPAQFEGAIQSIAIDAANNTVDVTVGNVVVTVDGQTTVTLNGQPAVLDDLQVGYNAAGLYDATNNHAIEIVLEGEGGGGQGGGDQGGNQGGGNQGQTAKTEGFIGIIGVSDILLDKEGTTLLLTVTGQTEILVNEQPATFADLLPGDKVKAKYDSGTNEAIQIMVEQ